MPFHNVPPRTASDTLAELQHRKSAERRLWREHLLDDLKERPVKLGEYFIAVFKLKANVVRLHPSDVLQKREKTVKRGKLQ